MRAAHPLHEALGRELGSNMAFHRGRRAAFGGEERGEKGASQKIQKSSDSPLTAEARRDYIRLTTRAAAPLATQTLALVNP